MNSKTNIVRAILMDASECERPEADHPATIEISATAALPSLILTNPSPDKSGLFNGANR